MGRSEQEQLEQDDGDNRGGTKGQDGHGFVAALVLFVCVQVVVPRRDVLQNTDEY
jgi:hypothetical protein